MKRSDFSVPTAFVSRSGLDLSGPLVATGFADQAQRARGRTPRVFRQDLGERLRLRATGARSGERPRGSRGPVFGRMAEVLSKNPAEPVHPAQRAGRDRRGVLSLGYFSLHKQRKVTRSRQRAKPGPSGRRQTAPCAFAASCIRIDHKQIRRLRLGMTVVSAMMPTDDLSMVKERKTQTPGARIARAGRRSAQWPPAPGVASRTCGAPCFTASHASAESSMQPPPIANTSALFSSCDSR